MGRILLAWLLFIAGLAPAADWPMLGRNQTRNAVSDERNAPIEWDLKTGRNIKWRAQLGSLAMSEPVVAGGLIWISTNNDLPRNAAQKGPAGVLMCFRERDGAFLYQYLAPATNSSAGLSRRMEFGLTGSPM